MANASGFYGSRSADSDDGWGPATSFRSATAPAAPAAPAAPSVPVPDTSGRGRSGRTGRSAPADRRSSRTPDPDHGSDYTSDHTAGPLDPRSDAYWARPDAVAPEQAAGSARERLAAVLPQGQAEYQRGLPGWAALLVLLVIAAIGGTIDMISGTNVRGGFNIGIVVASIVAILVVRRSSMFPVVIAPPIVYSLASGVTLYIRSGGLDDRKVLYDAAANWLVYGFPAIAAATASVLIVAGIRMIIRK